MTQDPQTADFLNNLWPDVPEGMELLIWTMPDKKSHWCKSAAAAAVLVAQLAASKDVYVMASLQPTGLSPQQRGLAATATALCGLWLDVDIAGDGHSSQPYPPTKEAALEILYNDSLPAPTWLIHSGGGFHAWWIFVEPWVLESDEERHQAAKLSEDWQALYRRRAQALGYTVDSTHDLTRVLRVPGTFNRKLKEHPRPVAVEAHSDVQLNPSEFATLIEEAQAYLLNEDGKTTQQKVVPITRPQPASDPSGLILNPQAEISPGAIRYLINRFPNFWPTWNGERQYKSGKNSQSEYDMCLANYAALAGWPDQKIIDLLIHNRRVRRQELPKHLKAYQKTIQAARQFATKQAVAATEDDTERPPDPDPAEKPDQPKAAPKKRTKPATDEAIELVRDELSAEIGTRVLRLIKIGRHDPQYRLETEAGDVLFGSADELFSQGKFRSKVGGQIDRVIPHYKDQHWPLFLHRLTKLIVNETADPDSDLIGSTMRWLTSYLEDNDFYETWDEARNKDRRDFPHSEAGHVYVNSTHFRTWVVKQLNEPLTTKEITRRFKLLGAENVDRSVRKPKTHISFWRLPAEDFDPQDFLPTLDPIEGEFHADAVDTANFV
jgi:hypothetical protein